MGHIAGTKSDTARVIVINEDNWTIESNNVVSDTPTYQVKYLVPGKKTILAIRSDSASDIYSGVDAVMNPYILATGGTVTTVISGGHSYYVHTFTSSGIFNVEDIGPTGEIEVLVVAGGGAGSIGGGGGGGVLYQPSIILNEMKEYAVVVGQGGQSFGANGQNSTFHTLTAIAGGGGGAWSQNGKAGGSGGGGGHWNTSNYTYGGAGTAGQGYAGGGRFSQYSNSNYTSGGGGGGGAIGQTAPTVGGKSGDGGIGKLISITGTPIRYGGGGGGGRPGTTQAQALYGLGGSGGGADGVGDSIAGKHGTANTGGGGGGVSNGAPTAGQGGSGIVIIRYLVA